MYKFRHMLRFNVLNTLLLWVVQKFVDTSRPMKVINAYAILIRDFTRIRVYCDVIYNRYIYDIYYI